MSDVRIYYENSIYMGPPEDIPSPVGVVALVTRCQKDTKHDVGRLVLHTCEFYIYEKGQWFGLYTDADLIDHVLWEKPDVILKGRWMPDKTFEDIVDDAIKFQSPNKEWPDKIGYWSTREGLDRKRNVSWAPLP